MYPRPTAPALRTVGRPYTADGRCPWPPPSFGFDPAWPVGDVTPTYGPNTANRRSALRGRRGCSTLRSRRLDLRPVMVSVAGVFLGIRNEKVGGPCRRCSNRCARVCPADRNWSRRSKKSPDTELRSKARLSLVGLSRIDGAVPIVAPLPQWEPWQKSWQRCARNRRASGLRI